MAKYDYVHMPSLDEYAERFKDYFTFKRVDGILQVTCHSKGRPVQWSYQMHHALAQMYTAIGHDTENEVIILTGTGENWIADQDAGSFSEVEQSSDNIQRYNCQIYDTMKIVENFVYDIEVPVIAALNGSNFHWENAFMADITLVTPDFRFEDRHLYMGIGAVPGDGMTLLMQELLGWKRGNYLMLTGEGLTAHQAYEMGAVSEIVEKDRLLERAWELAGRLMTRSRSARRFAHNIAMEPVKTRIEKDFRKHVLAEMYSVNLEKMEHDFANI
ncbi:MAG: enoyl-CoA hydratase/isomerase family protein [Firmicutes bacterium]|nr:enoyl-CoA hydratase/isomerase family protein [Bacillota bacterium]